MTKILFSENLSPDLKNLLQEFQYSSLHILCDSNTEVHCLQKLPEDIVARSQIIAIFPGEANKSIHSVEFIWKKLQEARADRNALLINLGGGMITDLGGFAASTFKRGIKCIHIPTSLMGMADAAIGGKTGINVGGIKNQAGTYYEPLTVIIHQEFLSTLPERELKSGMAEVYKYGLIYDARLWTQLYGNLSANLEVIKNCVDIKLDIVRQDPIEKGLRKILNFGHTAGHALEAHSHIPDNDHLLHGEAIAAGMIIETYLSIQKTGLDKKMGDIIIQQLRKTFPKVSIEENDIPDLIRIMENDKKNSGSEIQCALLTAIGASKWNVSCSQQEIEDAFRYYIRLWKS